MKKFLSIFIALAMVLSLFAGVGAHSAKAALAAGVISSTLVPDDTTYVAGTDTVKIVSTTVYGDMTAYSGSNIDGLVTLSKAFSTNVLISMTYGAGSTTVIGTYVLPAGSTTFWLSNFSGDYTHASTHQASLNTGATDVFNFSFTAPTDSGAVTITAQTVIAPTVYGGIGFEVAALRTVLSTATASFTVSANTLTVAKVVDPTLLYAGVPSYAYVRVTDVGGNAVTGLASTAFVPSTGSVSWTGYTFREVGYGIYEFSGMPDVAGTFYLTVTNGTATGAVSFNVAVASAIWNPTLSLTLPVGSTGLVVGGTVIFTGNYNVTPAYTLHDSLTKVTGPAWTSSSSSAFRYVIRSGGQFVVTLNANVWDVDNALTATPTYGKQIFKITPVVSGDQVTVDPTTVNVGDTKDVTVTDLQASGIERNNGKVVLSGATGMFTIPTGAVYTLADNAVTATVTLDASQTGYYGNLNIVGGKYVFAGLKFNHAGTVTITTYSYNGTSPTSIGIITVNPRVHVLTADSAKFVAGVAYPTVNVTGGITGLTFAGAYDDSGDTASLSTIDNGNGSYIFNVPAVADESGVTYTGTISTSPDDEYVLAMPIVKPTLTITSVHADGLITDSLAETVKFTLTDPVTGSVLSVVSPRLAPQYTTWDVTGNDNLAVSQLTGTTFIDWDDSDLGIYSATKAVATTGNDNLDTTVDKPYISILGTVSGIDITYADALLVSPAQLTITPADQVLYYGRDNLFSVKALDAHGAALEGANVTGTNAYNQVPAVNIFGGITGADGVVMFHYTPNYVGELYVQASTLGLTVVDGTAITLQIKTPPVDTTAPVITVANGIDGSAVTWDTLNLTGTVKDEVGVSQVYVGVNQVNMLPDGSFQTAIKLVPGDNTITITAYDAAGNKATATVKVTYNAAPAKTVIVLTIGTDVVTIDGKATSVDAAPEIVNSRTFVPIRFISETFGATVEWLPETQGITITLGDSTIGLQIGNATAVIDGNIISLPAAPYIKNSRTMVPLRVISEAFGGDVVWDAALRTITISYAILP